MDIMKHHTELQIGDMVWLDKAQPNIVYDKVNWEVVGGLYRVSKLHFNLVADFYPITYVEFDSDYNWCEDDFQKLIVKRLHEYRGSDMVEVKVEENK